MIDLSKLCIRYIARKLHFYENNNNLIYLPNHIKNEILTISTRTYRGVHDNKLFNALLNKDVKRLILTTSTVNDETLNIISRNCPNLELLIINGENCSLTKRGIIAGIPKLLKLKELHMKDCNAIDNNVISSISQSCSNLIVFNLAGCISVNDDCFKDLECLKLTALNLSGTGITDNFLIKLGASSLSNALEDLNLSNCSITCEGLKNLNWAKLKYIGFKGCIVNNLDFMLESKTIQFLEFTI